MPFSVDYRHTLPLTEFNLPYGVTQADCDGGLTCQDEEPASFDTGDVPMCTVCHCWSDDPLVDGLCPACIEDAEGETLP